MYRNSRGACQLGQAWVGCSAEAEAAEALVELGDLTGGIDQTPDAAGPGGMGLGIDIEAQGIARGAPCGARGVAAAIGHHHGNVVVIGMDIFLHFLNLFFIQRFAKLSKCYFFTKNE